MPRLSDDLVKTLMDGNEKLYETIKQIMPEGYEVYLYSQIRDGKKVPVLSFRAQETE